MGCDTKCLKDLLTDWEMAVNAWVAFATKNSWLVNGHCIYRAAKMSCLDRGNWRGPQPQHFYISSPGSDDQQQYQVQRWQYCPLVPPPYDWWWLWRAGNGYMGCNGYVPCQPKQLRPDLLAERIDGAMPCHNYKGQTNKDSAGAQCNSGCSLGGGESPAGCW